MLIAILQTIRNVLWAAAMRLIHMITAQTV